jgi:hypothetical protein
VAWSRSCDTRRRMAPGRGAISTVGAKLFGIDPGRRQGRANGEHKHRPKPARQSPTLPTVAVAWPKILRTSAAMRWHSSASRPFASCCESFVILDKLHGRTLRLGDPGDQTAKSLIGHARRAARSSQPCQVGHPLIRQTESQPRAYPLLSQRSPARRSQRRKP